MNPEDWAVARAERDASPDEYATNPREQFRRGYSSLGPDQREALHRTVTEHSGRSSMSSASSASIQYAEIGGGTPAAVPRPQPPSRQTTQRYSQTTQRYSAATQRLSRTQSETERINKLERHPTALDRIETHRTQHSQTVGGFIARTRSSARPLPNFGAGKPFPPPLPAREEYVVEFDGHDDPLHPQNWPMGRKYIISAVAGWFALCSTFSSSIFSAATTGVQREFGVGREVGTLSVSLFVLGYCFGPMIWGPLSELYGRKFPMVITAFGFSIFAIAIATAPNLQTVMLGRFFCGMFGSAPLVLTAAIFADIWNNELRGLAIACFSATVFMGPLLAPFIGGFIATSYLGWRWTEYIPSFMGFFALITVVLFLPETYPPAVLVSKAAELRRRTRNWGIHAKQEEVEVNLRELLTKNISRPLRIVFTEPIVLAVTIYMSFVYGLLYLFLTAYALVFQGVHHMSPGVAGLPYFGMILGELICAIIIFATNGSYVKKLHANDGVPVPEWRLPICIVGAVSFAVGLFWFGWTGYNPDIHWIVPTLSGLATGFGIFSIFLQLLNYIIDAYLMFAASALAGNTFVRSLAGAGFPLFARQMFDGMKIQYAATLLGGLAAVMVPMPVVFLMYGKKIRQKSKMAPALDLKLDAKRREMADAENGLNLTTSGSERAVSISGSDIGRMPTNEGKDEKDAAGLEPIETNTEKKST